MDKLDCRTNAIKFFLSYILSVFGYQFILFVMTVYVYDLTNSALNVGIFTALTFTPKLFSPYYGKLSDKYNRKYVLSLSLFFMFVLIIFMAKTKTIDIIYLLWFIISIFGYIGMNVRTALMTEIMPKNNYTHGNSLVLTSLNLARVLAPLIGGYIAVEFNPNFLLGATSFVYLIASILALIIKIPLGNITSKNVDSPTIKEGIQYILKSKKLSYLGMVAIGWRLFLGMQISLFVVYIESFLGLNVSFYGIFMAVIGIGSLLGSFLAPRIAQHFEISKFVIWGLLFHYITFSALGIIDNFYIATAISFISFMLFNISVVGVHSTRDSATKVNLRGRVYGSITAIVTPPALVSMLLGGYLAGIVGVGNVFIVSGLLASATLLITHLVFMRNGEKVANEFA